MLESRTVVSENMTGWDGRAECGARLLGDGRGGWPLPVLGSDGGRDDDGGRDADIYEGGLDSPSSWGNEGFYDVGSGPDFRAGNWI